MPNINDLCYMCIYKSPICEEQKCQEWYDNFRLTGDFNAKMVNAS